MAAVFRYGDRLVHADGDRIHLDPKESDLLAVLAKHKGHIVSRETCKRNLWPGEPTEEPVYDGRLKDVAYRLRAKVAPAGLGVHAVIKAGLMLTGDLSVDWKIR